MHRVVFNETHYCHNYTCMSNEQKAADVKIVRENLGLVDLVLALSQRVTSFTITVAFYLHAKRR